MHRTFGEVWICCFWDMLTCRQTEEHTHHSKSLLYWGQSSYSRMWIIVPAFFTCVNLSSCCCWSYWHVSIIMIHTGWVVNRKPGRHTLHGRRSAFVDPEVGSRSQGYQVCFWCGLHVDTTVHLARCLCCRSLRERLLRCVGDRPTPAGCHQRTA